MFAQRGLQRGATRLSIVSSVASAHSSQCISAVHVAAVTVQKLKQFVVILNPFSQYYNQLCIILATKSCTSYFSCWSFTLLHLRHPNVTTISPVIPLSVSVGIYS